MDMEFVHLIVCHLSGDILKSLHRYRFAGHIKHETADFIFRIILCNTIRHCPVVQLCDLKDGACSPVCTCCILCADSHILADIHDISFFSESVCLIADEIDIACLRSVASLYCHGCAQLCFIILCKSLSRIHKFGSALRYKDPAAYCEAAFRILAVPLSQLRDHRRLLIYAFAVIFARDHNVMFRATLCRVISFCHLVDTSNCRLCKRRIDRAVLSYDFFIICKKFYCKSFRNFRENKCRAVFVDSRYAKKIRNLFRSCILAYLSRFYRIALKLCHRNIRPVITSAVVAVYSQADLLRPYRLFQRNNFIRHCDRVCFLINLFEFRTIALSYFYLIVLDAQPLPDNTEELDSLRRRQRNSQCACHSVIRRIRRPAGRLVPVDRLRSCLCVSFGRLIITCFRRSFQIVIFFCQKLVRNLILINLEFIHGYRLPASRIQVISVYIQTYISCFCRLCKMNVFIQI